MNLVCRSVRILDLFVGSLALLLMNVASDSYAQTPDAQTPETPVSFQQDIMAVLTKAGCNAGVCHGNKFGKGGFKLSLLGQYPRKDYNSLTRMMNGRRINLPHPNRSLILLKATLHIAHEGGVRFARDSFPYQLLHNWIQNGARFDAGISRPTRINVSPSQLILNEDQKQFQLKVVAEYDDGMKRDVTNLAAFQPVEQSVSITPEGTVQRQEFGETTIIVRYLHLMKPVRVAFLQDRPVLPDSIFDSKHLIDQYLNRKLSAFRLPVSEICSDEIFIRRAYLDLLGMIPTGAEAQSFVRSSSDNKREELIADLLQRPEFADRWALLWSDLLRVEEKTLDRKGTQSFHAWIRNSFSQNKPMDKFVRELILARGSTYQHPPANYYRAMRDPFTRAESTAQLFLGIRLQCAKCHNHPFDRWTQEDYYGWSNFFSQIDYKIVKNKRRDKNDKHEFDGEQIVLVKKQEGVKNPVTNKIAPLRVLANPSSQFESSKDRLSELADWLTSRKNERFSESLVNRTWHSLMGRGIVDPIDDFRVTNPPTHPELLSELSKEFRNQNFDLRWLVTEIMTSAAYQRSSLPLPLNKTDDRNYSHQQPRQLTAEQLLDSISRVLEVPVEFNGYPKGLRASQIPGVRAVRLRDKAPSAGDQFLKLFGKPPRLQACECERSNQATLNQCFELVSGQLMNSLLTEKNVISRLLRKKQKPEALIAQLYWKTLTRAPSEQELQIGVEFLKKHNSSREALEDLLWSLMNTKEFLLRT